MNATKKEELTQKRDALLKHLHEIDAGKSVYNLVACKEERAKIHAELDEIEMALDDRGPNQEERPMDVTQITRRGTYIRLADGLTASENYSENLPILTIRRNGRLAKRYRASYLVFENPLTDEDRRLLAELAENL